MGTVLIVEDSAMERKLLSGYLQTSGLEVVMATSGEEALQQIERSQPDAIVLDIVLPGLSGFEICRQLKNNETTQQIPIILCSTKDTAMDKFWGLKQGADAYITKPVDKVEFLRTLNQFFDSLVDV
ncbi:MAG: response regulator [Cyanobacteria bacterium P01_H01_bin.15]